MRVENLTCGVDKQEIGQYGDATSSAGAVIMMDNFPAHGSEHLIAGFEELLVSCLTGVGTTHVA